MDTESKTSAAKVETAVSEDKADKNELPTKIKMVKMWGFVDKKGVDHLWQAGQVVDDPAEIKMIIDCKFEGWTSK